MAGTGREATGADVRAGPSSAPSSSSWHYTASLPATDALPYYDDEMRKPGMQAKVDRALAREMARGSVEQVGEDRLPGPMELFAQHEELRTHLQHVVERKQKGVTADALDRTRYQLAPPAAGEGASAEEWESALQNAEAQLMHAEGRRTNLELLKKFGANQWRLHNFQQEAFVRTIERARDARQDETSAMNRERKQVQTSAGTELTRLHTRWADLLNRSLSVELANLVAASEIQALQARKDALRTQLDAEAVDVVP